MVMTSAMELYLDDINAAGPKKWWIRILFKEAFLLSEGHGVEWFTFQEEISVKYITGNGLATLQKGGDWARAKKGA